MVLIETELASIMTRLEDLFGGNPALVALNLYAETDKSDREAVDKSVENFLHLDERAKADPVRESSFKANLRHKLGNSRDCVPFLLLQPAKFRYL